MDGFNSLSYSQSALNFPAQQEIAEIVRRFNAQPARFRGLREIFPLKPYYGGPLIRWDVLQAVTGRTTARNLDADPKIVTIAARAQMAEMTTYWGDTYRLRESDLLNARAAGAFNRRAGMELVTEAMYEAFINDQTLVEYTIWQALVTGQLAISENGVQRTVTYNQAAGHQITVGTLWSDTVNSTPINDLQAASLLFRGTGFNKPTVWMNQKTANYMAENTSVLDRVSRNKLVLDANNENIGELITSLAGGLKQIEIYDEGYVDPLDGFTLFIPDGKVVMIGQMWMDANGATIRTVGQWMTTPSLHNGGIQNPQCGFFMVADDDTRAKNPRYEITHGINGLPIVQYPEGIVILTVA